MIEPMDFWVGGFLGSGLHIRLDGFRLVYLCIAVVMWGLAGVFSREYMAHYEKKTRYYLFFWATFAATAGVFLSADLLTTFLFFEIMSFTSYVWVAFDERPESLRGAETYLAVAVGGGLVMLMGLFLLWNLFGTLEMDGLRAAAGALLGDPAGQQGKVRQLYAAAALLLFGFGAKAGCVPLHIWLPKAHPVAPAPASALLSGILTKAGVFGIILVSCGMLGSSYGWGLLVAGLGLVTMFWGGLLAMFSINLKKTLACSSVSQIGFILTGIGVSCLLRAAGESPELAVRGAFLHMCNHSVFKLVLFLCAGVVYMNLHQLDFNEIRGFGRGKWVLLFCYCMGALGIGGIPLWSGYVSKTLLHEGIVEYLGIFGGVGFRAAEWVFLFSGGMTVAYMLKIFFVLFVEKNPDMGRQEAFDKMSKTYVRPASAAAILLPSALVLVLGATPNLTMDRIAALGQGFFGLEESHHVVSYFAFQNLKGSLVSVSIGLALYVVVIRKGMVAGGAYVDRWPWWLDLEYLVYRPFLQVLLPNVLGAVCRVADINMARVLAIVLGALGAVCGMVDRYCITVPYTVFMAVFGVLCRGMDHLADALILAARKTTHSQRPAAMLRQKSPSRRHAWQVLASFRENICHTGMLVEESLSFGLMLVGIGLCLTLGYLLYAFYAG